MPGSMHNSKNPDYAALKMIVNMTGKTVGQNPTDLSHGIKNAKALRILLQHSKYRFDFRDKLQS